MQTRSQQNSAGVTPKSTAIKAEAASGQISSSGQPIADIEMDPELEQEMQFGAA